MPYVKRCNIKSVLTNHITSYTANTQKRSNCDLASALQTFPREKKKKPSFVRPRAKLQTLILQADNPTILSKWLGRAITSSFLLTIKSMEYMRSYSDSNFTSIKRNSHFSGTRNPHITHAVRIWPLEYSPPAHYLLRISKIMSPVKNRTIMYLNLRTVVARKNACTVRNCGWLRVSVMVKDSLCYKSPETKWPTKAYFSSISLNCKLRSSLWVLKYVTNPFYENSYLYFLYHYFFLLLLW